MNKIIVNGLVFDDNDTNTKRDGKLVSGDYNLNSSLGSDELPVDTLKVTVRYPLEGNADTRLTKLEYATECLYYQNDVLFKKFYFESAKRVSKYEYTLEFLTAIGILKNRTHYGGLYNNTTAKSIIENIMGVIPTGYNIKYTIAPEYAENRVSGWLPIAPASENLNQVLFIYGGTIEYDTEKNIVFSFLKPREAVTIEDSKIFQGGSVTYNTPVSQVEVIEHQYSVPKERNLEVLFEGTSSNKEIINPYTGEYVNGALIPFNGPYFGLQFEGCTSVRSDTNYCIIHTATDNTPCVVKGIPYQHTTSTVSKDNMVDGGVAKGKVAQVKDATLVSARNSNTVAARSLRRYSKSDILQADIVADNMRTKDCLVLRDNFDEIRTGYVSSIEGTLSKNVIKNDVNVVLDYSPYDPANPKALDHIYLWSPPKKVVYASGEYFDNEGASIIAVYTEGTEVEVFNYSYKPITPLKLTDKEVVYYYTYNGVTKVVSYPITVATLPISLDIINPPDKLNYNPGDTLDLTGLKLLVTYSDGSFKELKDDEYTYEPQGELTGQVNVITFHYTEYDTEVTAKLDIFFGEGNNLQLISVTTPPNITEYQEGSYFDPTGMVVTGTFDDGSTRVIENYSYSPTTPLKKGEDTITITVVWVNGTFTTTYKISNYYLYKLSIKNSPNKIDYYEGDDMNNEGLLLEAVYSNGKTRVLRSDEYTYTPQLLHYTTKKIRYDYTERGETVYAWQNVNVNYYPYEYTKSVVWDRESYYNIPEPVTIDKICPGYTHRNIRVNYIGLPERTDNKLIVASNPGTNAEGSITITQKDGTGTWTIPSGSPGEGSKHTSGLLGGPITSKDIIIPNEESKFLIRFDSAPYNSNVPDRIARLDTSTPYPAHEKDIRLPFDNNQCQSRGFVDDFTGKRYAVKGPDGTVDGGKGGEANQAGGSIPGFDGGKPGLKITDAPIVLRHVDTYPPHVESSFSAEDIVWRLDQNLRYIAPWGYPPPSKVSKSQMARWFPSLRLFSGYSDYSYDKLTGIVTLSGSYNEFGIWGAGEGDLAYVQGGSYGASSTGMYGYPDFYISKDGSRLNFGKINSSSYIPGCVMHTNVQNPSVIPDSGTSVATFETYFLAQYGPQQLKDPSGNNYSTIVVIKHDTTTITRTKQADDVYEVKIEVTHDGGGGSGAGYQTVGNNGVEDDGGNGAAKYYGGVAPESYGTGPAGREGAGGGGAGGGLTVKVSENRSGAISKVGPYSYTFTGGKGGKAFEIDPVNSPVNKGGKDAFIIYYS